MRFLAAPAPFLRGFRWLPTVLGSWRSNGQNSYWILIITTEYFWDTNEIYVINNKQIITLGRSFSVNTPLPVAGRTLAWRSGRRFRGGVNRPLPWVGHILAWRSGRSVNRPLHWAGHTLVWRSGRSVNRPLPWAGRILVWRSDRRFHGGTRPAAPQGVRVSAARSLTAPPARLLFYKYSQSKCSVTNNNNLFTPAFCCTEFQL